MKWSSTVREVWLLKTYFVEPADSEMARPQPKSVDATDAAMATAMKDRF
ncbi:MAG: hypothetical protein Q8L48_39615 [Archangium sp.]|nr:hypothetical protein [Archangium sp.]